LHRPIKRKKSFLQATLPAFVSFVKGKNRRFKTVIAENSENPVAISFYRL
jgi:hypothetical protein